MAGVSLLADDLGAVKRLEDAGAAAIVMYSLFEEQILREIERAASYIDRPAESFPEALSYFLRTEDFKFRLGPDEYLEQIARIKRTVNIPVIGSLNGVTTGGWMDYAHRIEEAGAHGTQIVSALLRNGPEHVGRVKGEVTVWMKEHDYESVNQMRGSMSLLRCPDPSAVERANYIRVLHGGYA